LDDELDEETPDKKKRPRLPDVETKRWGRIDRRAAAQRLAWADQLQVDWTTEPRLVGSHNVWSHHRLTQITCLSG
jgi:hypothetical protein